MQSSKAPPIVNDAAEITSEAATHGTGNWLAVLISGLALTGSVVSLWETTLRQPEIKLYVSENIQYTRDPYGPFEGLAVPVTITNSGARDGAVLSLQLEAKNPATGQIEKFKSSYVADAQYFGSRDDVAERLKRPKVPFAPISVSGRSAFTGTILFYRPGSSGKNLIEPASKLDMTVSVTLPAPAGWLDKALATDPPAVTIKADVPTFFPGALLSGDNAPLQVTSGAF
ncbi:MAG: hypothetical protein JSR89_12455 [Proteobacteria bacterium]|nr:hypothetical protein [Pseudomonadota bacterium]